jgi:hypothetical protein
MNRKLTPVLVSALALVLVVPPAAEAKPAEACGDIYPSMALGPLRPEAETTPFFFAAEGGAGSFRVHFTGIDCGSELKTTAAYAAAPGSASAADYTLAPGRTDPVCGTVRPGCPNEDSVDVGLAGSDGAEAVAESFTISLSDPQVNGNPNATALSPPSSAAFVIVDADGEPRVAFDDLTYSRSETYATMTIPVWRAGSDAPTTVPYMVGPGPGTSATGGDDYSVISPNPLAFAANDPVEVITLAIVNDKLSEPEETVELTLQSPTDAALATPSTKVVSILDNEENVAPTSRFHHPRHRWRYKKSDYRIREFHVFAHDEEGGSGVVATELALRRNLENGKCAWKTKKGWQKKDCQNRTWLPTKFDDVGELFYYRMNQLKSSVGTKIKDYTAFSRAIDGAGNVEKDFVKKRNDNTFEIKRAKRRS